VPTETNLTDLARRWLDKPIEQVTESERGVLAHVHHRRPVSRRPHPADQPAPTFGERLADRVARFGGSWPFIGLFGAFLLAWVLLNSTLLVQRPVDPYPFIFLNLLLSMLAAIQAPIIMMSQNRLSRHDRAAAEHDYEVNLKAEIEILALHDKLEQLRVQQVGALLHGQQEQLELLRQMLAGNASAPPRG
jgi:uncharacterized membrane protein